MGRFAGAALAILCATGCAAVGGRSRAFEATRLAADPGWVTAAPTPVVRQDGPQDCGAAALAMVAGRWQVRLTSQDAVAALPPSPQGARLGDLRALARAHGLLAFAVAGDRETLLHELRAGRPVVVGLLIPLDAGHARSHYEVVVAAHPGRDEFVTIDPATSWRVRTWADLDAEWRPAGRPALVVTGLAPAIAAPVAVAPSTPLR